MNARLTLLATFATAALAGLALHLGDFETAPWMVARASGLVAFALLSVSVTFGLLITTKAIDRTLSRPLVFHVHQFTSVLALSFATIHAGALLFDRFLTFTVVDLVVPFTGPYRAGWVGLGVAGGWLMALVTASFWARRAIGQRAWRSLHYASFAAYGLALVHAVAAGTDAALAPVQALYALSAATIAALLVYRIGAARAARNAGVPRSRPSRAASPSVRAGAAIDRRARTGLQ
jgi:predicted ferric reductase